jgi:hypothetical protein
MEAGFLPFVGGKIGSREQTIGARRLVFNINIGLAR